jgi:cytochrome c oxidase assembly protein subunit 15
VFFALLLIAMGGFVTSINAGLAVPDWPTSFGSMDPFRPLPEWWKITPVLAEHGHRLLGALVGLLTTVLTVWTWRTDPRSWMRKLGIFALVLVIFQGVLGGFRVVWISLDLAVVHACMAQLFFGILLFMTLATSRTWLHNRYEFRRDEAEDGRYLRFVSIGTAGILYIQIILGALLRHPGEGIDTVLAYTHIGGATVALLGVLAVGRLIYRRFRQNPILQVHRWLLYGLVALQIGLGLIAYVVLLNETGRLVQPSALQVIVNTSHLVIGSLLFGTAVSLALWLMRQPLRQKLTTTAREHPPTSSQTHPTHLT